MGTPDSGVECGALSAQRVPELALRTGSAEDAAGGQRVVGDGGGAPWHGGQPTASPAGVEKVSGTNGIKIVASYYPRSS
jgi:hypothetical protein